ncbi:FhaA domain-containing protein [Pectinatus haikarae]|uniref:FHA domain-containing protein n=1 Tax=Pectinatus haikarae TaxID=349096 RepID=A0ABT9Y3C8_9FIRM|nr:FhaA domain-containing protein [Pectinatus haikarae]MDQ0202323.1 hypothetical protein [Pectinatus haikarae]
MSFSKMETFLEKHIEGFFNRKFASDLQFAEIQKNIAHIINRNRTKINGMSFAPNYYEILMSEIDYGRICSRKSREMLYEYIVCSVMRQDLFIEDAPFIKFSKNNEMKKGSCDIRAAYMKDEEKDKEICDVAEKTIVIQKPTIKETAAMPSEHVYAVLTVTEGKDIDAHLDIGSQQIHMGRREENEFLLTDPNVSRLHAYISFEKCRHILYDANSLNGTFVNGRKISASCLKDKDIIDMGHTQMVYEVL